jgi:fumarylpyruvate hydrolase
MHRVFPPDCYGVPVRGTAVQFPVRRIFCVARNYAAHAREMGASAREDPFFFMKPACAMCAVTDQAVVPIAYPPRCENLQPEVELVVAIGEQGRDLDVHDAHRPILGYAVGLDMTRRDVQAKLKEKGHPWELAKAFDQSAPLSVITPVADCGHPQSGAITLSVNGAIRQRGDIEEMIWSVPELISTLSRWFVLMPGDLVFTGTPAGVGPVQRGDLLHAQAAGVAQLRVTIA